MQISPIVSWQIIQSIFKITAFLVIFLIEKIIFYFIDKILWNDGNNSRCINILEMSLWTMHCTHFLTFKNLYNGLILNN